MDQETKPADETDEARTPLYWLRQRCGEIDTVRLNADEAAMIAQRPGGHGDHMKPSGFVWREPDNAARGGYAFFTLTPVFAEPR